MFGDLQYMMLYLAVALIIFGFLAAFYASSMTNYKSRGGLDIGSAETDVNWGPVGVGKTYDRAHFKWFGCSTERRCEWSYASAYDPAQDVWFDDPADAYEYVIEALKAKNQMIERLENKTWKGLPANYDWIWIDAHIDREYWLDKLNEFKEDC
jgi:hypothetical protein